MNLLAIEIDLDAFFDVNLIVFTTLSFVFSVAIISFLVFALRPLNRRAAIAQGKIPEKLNITYIRLIIFGFAQFIAFVADIFLVIFGHGYKLPFFTSGVFLILAGYKMVFVLFKDFKALGYNAEGVLTTVKIAGKVFKDKDLSSLTDAIETVQNSENYDIVKKQPEIESKKIKMKDKLPPMLLVLILIAASSFCLTGNSANATPVEFEHSAETRGVTVENVELEDLEDSDNILIIKFKGKRVMYNL